MQYWIGVEISANIVSWMNNELFYLSLVVSRSKVKVVMTFIRSLMWCFKIFYGGHGQSFANGKWLSILEAGLEAVLGRKFS